MGILTAEQEAPVETFWRNFYLRGQTIFDDTGGTVVGAYGQPSTGLPASRGFIIAPDQTLALPYFMHRPDFAIDKMCELLAAMLPGDLDADEDVDIDDYQLFFTRLRGPEAYETPPLQCGAGDLDGDLDVDLADYALLQIAIGHVEKGGRLRPPG